MENELEVIDLFLGGFSAVNKSVVDNISDLRSNDVRA